VLWLPVWLQVVLFVAAVLIGPYRFFMVIPAIISDAVYAPTAHFSLAYHWMTLFVFALLGLHWFIMKKLRIPTMYGVEA
jgi:hypothetical protein